jgi:hypothetical protein
MFKLMRITAGMYRVYDSDKGIDTQGGLFETMDAMRALNVPIEETQAALADMQARDTNCADFGINLKTGAPGFIFSDRREVGREGHKLAVIAIPEDEIRAA